ncbi:MAG: hypothetical protein CR997_08980 [Acidobacteria bacterium]|nr:MAG: hypothetical protein CR997_08980 [Acidobacteriota bacterium]
MEQEQQKREFMWNFKFSGLVLLMIWFVAFLTTFFPELKQELGVIPRSLNGAYGIITMWLVHKDQAHLLSNSSPVFLLCLFTMLFYPKIAYKVLASTLVLAGAFLWCFGRGYAVHIGASGWIYALAAFLFFSGIFRRDKRSIGAALLVAFLYGGMVWGIFPVYKDVSWDGHLFGAIAGGMVALYYRDHYREPLELEEDDLDEEGPEYWKIDYESDS